MSFFNSNPFDWHYDDGGDLDHEILEIHGRSFSVFSIFSVLFIIAVIATALMLYSRRIFFSWAFSSSQTRHAPLTSPSQQGLEPETIKKLPIVLHRAPSDQDSARECCICLSAFRMGEKLKVLPGCDHCFHCECVDNWLQNHSNCPLCRASLQLHGSSFPTILIQEPPVRHS
ncbi:hypothetical protein TanjilG_18916 [Lupinus angustifolius]|uniref:RING-type E3 ubiquitin transferase n=1 Tax=Lupinus angustifolius TaxID=3871 RepID=A0A4P1RR10_LUPAN|nr:PREDICTED: RING-H2 finger protein ATL66-like [Lupinus angustifolius]OIW16201.1 hypothetical protein TanjilG_18916 [Lupinus angustifolius]